MKSIDFEPIVESDMAHTNSWKDISQLNYWARKLGFQKTINPIPAKGSMMEEVKKLNLFDFYKRWNTIKKIMFWGLIAVIGFIISMVCDFIVRIIKW